MRALKPKQLLYQAVQQEVKSYIVQNSLRAGDSLPSETELAQKLGVSRTSVREAVKSLETLGIVEARPGAGLFVRSFSFDPLLDNLAYGLMFDLKDLNEILEVRSHLEYGMVEKAIQAVTPEQIEELRRVLEQMRLAAAEGRYAAEDDRIFHQILWENVDNRIFGKILDIFWMIFHQASRRASIPDVVDPMDTYRRHVIIVDALEQRDVAAMRASMVLHRSGIEARLRQTRDEVQAP